MKRGCPLIGKTESGFTLVELIIVMAVFGILTAIAIPTFISMMPKYRLNGAARQVMGDLMSARMKAVEENNEFKIFFLNNHEYMILDDDDNDGSADAGEAITTQDIQDNYHDVTFSSTNNPIFHPRGTATSLPTITLQNSSGSKKITISIAGRVKIN